MASVSQTLTLQDKVTPVLNNIIRSMQATLSVMNDVDRATNGDITGSHHFENLKKTVDSASNAMREFNAAQANASATANNGLGPVIANIVRTMQSLDAVLGDINGQFNGELINTKHLNAFRKGLYGVSESYKEMINTAAEASSKLGAAQEKLAADATSKVNPAVDSVNESVQRLSETVTKTQKTMGKGLVDEKHFKDFESNFDEASQDVKNFKNSAVRDLNDFKKAQEGVGDTADRVTKKFGGWKLNIIAANSALSLIRKTMDIFSKPAKYADTMTQMASRLALINDGSQDLAELQDKIYQSAQRSRSSYAETVESVARLNLLAKRALPTNDDAIKFSEIMNKSFAISGANAMEMNGAMRQMVQALSSGRLQGDEFVSITENAPLISQALQKHLGVTYEEFRKLSRDAKITSDIIVEAVFAAGDEINEMFARMPMTYEQTMQYIKNSMTRYTGNLVKMFSDALNSNRFIKFRNSIVDFIKTAMSLLESAFKWIGRIWDTDGIQEFVSIATRGFAFIASIAQSTLRGIGTFVEFALSKWKSYSGVIYGVVSAFVAYKTVLGVLTTLQATGIARERAANAARLASLATTKGLVIAQYAFAAATGNLASATLAAKAAAVGLNATLLASPYTWVAASIAAIIGLVVMASKYFTDWGDTAETTVGTITGAMRTIGIVLKQFLASFYGVVAGIVGAVSSVISNAVTAISKFISTVQAGFYRMLSGIATGMEKILLSMAGFSDTAGSKAIDFGNAAATYKAKAALLDRGLDEKGNRIGRDYVSVGDAFVDTYFNARKDAEELFGVKDWSNTDFAKEFAIGAHTGDSFMLGDDYNRSREEDKILEAQRLVDKITLEKALKPVNENIEEVNKTNEKMAGYTKAGAAANAGSSVENNSVAAYDGDTVAWHTGYTGFEPRSSISKSNIARNRGDLDAWYAADRYGGLGGMYDAWTPSEFKHLKSSNGSLAVEVTGGKLDSDRQLSQDLLDIWKEFLHQRIVNQYTTEKPTVNATFGDVRETADVGKLITALESVVGQAFNTVLR